MSVTLSLLHCKPWANPERLTGELFWHCVVNKPVKHVWLVKQLHFKEKINRAITELWKASLTSSNSLHLITIYCCAVYIFMVGFAYVSFNKMLHSGIYYKVTLSPDPSVRLQSPIKTWLCISPPALVNLIASWCSFGRKWLQNGAQLSGRAQWIWECVYVCVESRWTDAASVCECAAVHLKAMYRRSPCHKGRIYFDFSEEVVNRLHASTFRSEHIHSHFSLSHSVCLLPSVCLSVCDWFVCLPLTFTLLLCLCALDSCRSGARGLRFLQYICVYLCNPLLPLCFTWTHGQSSVQMYIIRCITFQNRLVECGNAAAVQFIPVLLMSHVSFTSETNPSFMNRTEKCTTPAHA